MLEQLLASHKDELLGALTSKLGVSSDQAGGFLSKLIGMIQSLIGDGKLDVQDLLKGDVSSLTGKLNMDELGGLLGGGKEQAEQGLSAVIGPLSEKIGGLGDAGDLLGKITGNDSGGGGGIMGAIGGILGKK
ncbi:MAG TPA: hypothetical protein ENJ00_05165 [Phycisphaerales bacterium]|nr:hypothetical protein [Phycisphaerales bacterium]